MYMRAGKQSMRFCFISNLFHKKFINQARNVTKKGVAMYMRAGKQSMRFCFISNLFLDSDFVIFDLIFSMHFFLAPPNFFVISKTFGSRSASDKSDASFSFLSA